MRSSGSKRPVQERRPEGSTTPHSKRTACSRCSTSGNPKSRLKPSERRCCRSWPRLGPTPASRRSCPFTTSSRVEGRGSTIDREVVLSEPLRVNDLLRTPAERASRYLTALPERRVAPADSALRRLADFDEPFPDGPDDPAGVIALLDEAGSPATVASAGPRFFGFVIGGSLPVAVAANWLAGAWDQNAGAFIVSPVAAKIEEVAQRWLLDVFGLPTTTIAGFVSGATMANLTAL